MIVRNKNPFLPLPLKWSNTGSSPIDDDDDDDTDGTDDDDTDDDDDDDDDDDLWIKL
jgi:hypothetical protein